MAQERIVERDKRFVSISKYQEMTGLSYQTVKHLIKSNQINYITTESGIQKIDTKTNLTEIKEIVERLEKQEKMLTALCKQFNTAM